MDLVTITAVFALALGAELPTPDRDFGPISTPPGAAPDDLPPIPLPSFPAPPSGKRFSETEDSPALDLSSAWLRLGEGQKLEQSASTRALWTAWQSTLREKGPSSMETAKTEAEYLRQRAADLDAARGVYEEVGLFLDSLGGEAEGRERENLRPLIDEFERLEREIDAATSLMDAACFIDPGGCVAPDADNQRLVREISGLLASAGGEEAPDLGAGSLAQKALLLGIRARVALRLIQRQAAELAMRVVTPRDGSGAIKALAPSPKPGAQKPTRYVPGNPYR